jgi:predicted  nucleic acid-binding Zn-ribbon protein
MKCLICDAKSTYFFSKQYSEYPFNEFMREIGDVEYYKCTRCGFVLSKTHSELSEVKWSCLNENFHHFHEKESAESEINQPPYAEQALMISLLGKSHIIDSTTMLDYAAGYGTLSNILHRYFNIELPVHDPYVKAFGNTRCIENPVKNEYGTVINSAMFEHVLNRTDLDSVNDLVHESGSLIIHTVVCENIPKDPEWFYLRPPVHTAFHTNKSMEVLMHQWGYKSSVYCLPAKSWVLFRDPINCLRPKIEAINKELQSNWFYCKEGFVDYWKGF